MTTTTLSSSTLTASPRSAARSADRVAALDPTRVAATLLRLALGVTMLAHGLLKVFVFTMPGTVAFFVAQGYPAFTAWLVMAGEIAAGVGLITGVLVRVASVGLLPILIGVVATVAPNGWVFNAENGGGWEFPAMLVVVAVVQALLGPGYLALGDLFSRRRQRGA